MKKKLIQLVQVNIYQSNTYRKDLEWLLFTDKPRVQQKQKNVGPTVLPTHLFSLPSIYN